jgi:hypothetical protein
MKVVRLTESDLTRIIKRVLLETYDPTLKLKDTELVGKGILFYEKTGLIPRNMQSNITKLEQVKLPTGYETVKLTLSNGKELTYNCKYEFVDLREVMGSDGTPIEKKSFAGWKKYTKWKNTRLQDIIESRKYCGRNASENPTPLPGKGEDLLK